MRLADMRHHLPRRMAPELCDQIRPRHKGGRREGRALAAPVARLQNRKQAAVTTGLAETPGLPCATVGTAYTWSPWCAGLVGHHRWRDARAPPPA
ncbi:hypothetical protein BRAO375_230022 [Bradyrhizobium sp. ORS 375]|nr:hypothetical protein BRAO375_230022 [Bradyrhizobium sp. ORS 375]